MKEGCPYSDARVPLVLVSLAATWGAVPQQEHLQPLKSGSSIEVDKVLTVGNILHLVNV